MTINYAKMLADAQRIQNNKRIYGVFDHDIPQGVCTLEQLIKVLETLREYMHDADDRETAETRKDMQYHA